VRLSAPAERPSEVRPIHPAKWIMRATIRQARLKLVGVREKDWLVQLRVGF